MHCVTLNQLIVKTTHVMQTEIHVSRRQTLSWQWWIFGNKTLMYRL